MLAAAAAAVLLTPTAALAAPNAPTAVTAVVAPGTGVVTVDWTAPAAGDAVADYVVQYTNNTLETAWADVPAGSCAIEVTATAGPCDVTGLTPGSSYAFRVFAKDALNAAGPASTSSSSVIALAPPNVGGIPAVSVTGPGTISVNWAAPTVDSGHAAATGYKVQSSAGGGVWVDTTCVGMGAADPCVVTGLMAGTSYVFRVLTTNAQGSTASESSDPIVAIDAPNAAVKPTATITGTTGGELSVSWTAPTATPGNPNGTYAIMKREVGGDEWTEACASVPANPCVVTGLTGGTSYEFVLAATNDAGTTYSATSTPVTAMSLPVTPVVTTTVIGEGTVRVSWPQVGTSAAPATYKVSMSSDGGETYTDVTTGECTAPSTSPCNITGLTVGTDYTFKVTATNTAGTTFGTDEVVTTPEAPGTPTITADGDLKLKVVWEPADPNTAASYKVEITDSTDDDDFAAVSADDEHTTCDGVVNASPCYIAGLEAGKQYRVRIIAVNTAGDSDPSTASAAAYVITGPGQPTDLTAVVAGDEAIKLTWTAPAETPSTPVDYYVVEYSADGGDWIPVGCGVGAQGGTAVACLDAAGNKVGAAAAEDSCINPTGTTCTMTGLDPGVSYEFRVTAVNDTAVGEEPSAVSDAVLAVSTPTIISVTPDDIGSLELVFEGPDAGAADSYRVYVSPTLDGDYVLVDEGTCVEDEDGPVPAGCTVTGLTPGQEYFFGVAGVTDDVESDWSPIMSATAIGNPIAPDKPTLTVTGERDVKIEWGPEPTDANPVDHYLVYATLGDGEPYEITVGECNEPTTTHCTVTGLSKGGYYTFHVKAVNTLAPEGVASAESDPIVVNYVDPDPTEPPADSGTPGKPVASLNDDGSLQVEWDPPADAADLEIEYYMVEVKIDDADWVEVTGDGPCAGPSIPTCTYAEDPADGVYSFRVTAMNGVDFLGETSEASDPITIPGGVVTPTPPTGIASPLDSDEMDELAYVVNGTVWAWHNTDGLTGGNSPYTQNPVAVGTGFEAARTRFANIDGDDKKELIYIAANGDVWAFHNGAASATGRPYGDTGYRIGTHFVDPTSVRFADFNGDGLDEITYIHYDSVWAWQNVGGSTTGSPYTGSKTEVGKFFNPMQLQFADLDGDKRAEIINVAWDKVWAWENTTADDDMSIDSFPYTAAAVEIGRWFIPGHTTFADVDGDGRSEISLVDSVGRVWVWRNVLGAATMPYTEAPILVGTGFVNQSDTMYSSSS
ncbi:MAG TPA: fibronectin type III domain-containing protein [Micromonosporaceae bacterium]|nr:fibronectin type III domain-containing protein [Micromonosporaceae bacterium]